MNAHNAGAHGTNSIRQIVFAFALAALAPCRTMALGPAPVNLGASTQFAILAGSAISSTGGGDIYGDVGLSPGGGTSIGVIQTQTHGVIYAVDELGPVGSVMAPALLTAAKNDLTAAYIDAADRTPVPSGPFLNPGAGNIGGLNLVPGLYKFTAGALISSDVTLTGGPDDVWIFQIGSDLTVGSGVQVVLAGGAAARNIFWQVGSSATLDTFCDFKGTIMADQSITMNTSCTVEGRALARIAMVTFNGERINLPRAAPYNAGGRVWLDENADALQDAGEAGIANVSVQLLDTNSVGVAETITDTEGRYRFAGLNFGAYVVRVEAASMPDGLAGNQTYDPDATLDHQTVIALSADVPAIAADFGYNWASTGEVLDPGSGATGAIGDRVWIDSNGDGVQDPGEPGLGGIPVAIYYDSNSNGTYDALYTAAVDQNGVTATGTTTTEPDGSYVFYNLPVAAYVIVVNGGDDPVGYTQTGDPDDFSTLAASPDNRTTMPVILAPGDLFVNADFGYQPADSSTITGTIYLDAAANASLDGVDYGTAGVSLALLNAGSNVVATTRTDTDGHYEFTGLPAGDHTVWVNDTGNLLGGLYQTEDPDPTKDSRTTVTVDGGSNVSGVDFGFSPTGPTSLTGLIGDHIWLDSNGNGLQDAADSGLQGVAVQLFASDGTNLLATTVTDANGNYGFGGLSTNDMTYIVRVDTLSLPNGGLGLTNTHDPDDGGAPPHVGDSESTVTLTGSAPIRLDQDFSFAALNNPNTLSGTIWEDRNADGALDAVGETNRFESVTVVLSDTNGNVIATTATGTDGIYSFPGLPDGSYVVDVTEEANLLNGYWHSRGAAGDGTAAGTPAGESQSAPYVITVSGGADAIVDFGYYVAGAKAGNRVWFDIDANGRQDDPLDETGIADVTLKLTIHYANGDSVVVTTVTDADGFYSFGNLLLDENHNGASLQEPEYVILVINPNNPLYQNHTVHNAPGVPESLNSDYPLGVLATVVQGVDDVSANTDPSLEAEPGWNDFGFTAEATLAVITAVRSRIEDGMAIISWDVSLEIDTVGYHIERWADGAWTRVNETLIWADPFALAPKTYEQSDPGAPLGTTQRYQIVDLDGQGRLRPYGPYDLELDGGEISYDTWAADIDWGDADSSQDADSDGDGLTNWQEYLAGTDPLDANSVLRVTRIRPVAGGIELAWDSEPGRTYGVEMATAPNGPFTAIETQIPANAPSNHFVVPVDPSAVKAAYFRVIVEKR